MSKKANIMSLCVDPEIQEKIKQVAKKRNISVSKLIRDLVEKNLPNEGEEIDVIILKIPKTMRNQRAELSSWIVPRVEAIINALCKTS
jgi:hypothetical protein